MIGVDRLERVDIRLSGQNKTYFGEQLLLSNNPIAYITLIGDISNTAYQAFNSKYVVLVDNSRYVINRLPLVNFLCGQYRGGAIPVFNKCIDWGSSYILDAQPGNSDLLLRFVVGVNGKYAQTFEENSIIENTTITQSSTFATGYRQLYFNETPSFADYYLKSIRFDYTDFVTPNFTKNAGSLYSYLYYSELTLIDKTGRIFCNKIPPALFAGIPDYASSSTITYSSPFAFMFNNIHVDWGKSFITYNITTQEEREFYFSLLMKK